MKWLWKLETSEELWQEMLHNKYLANQPLSTTSCGPGDSHFWQGLMEIKYLFVSLARSVVGDGARTLFWEDVWLEGGKLANAFPRPYNITFDKMVTVKQVMKKGWENVTIRRSLHGEYLAQWMR